VNAPVGSRNPVYIISCAVELLGLVTSDEIISSFVIVEKAINIYQNSRSQTAMESVWSVSKLSTESVGSRHELVANSHRRRRLGLNSTVKSRRRRGVYWTYRSSIFTCKMKKITYSCNNILTQCFHSYSCTCTDVLFALYSLTLCVFTVRRYALHGLLS